MGDTDKGDSSEKKGDSKKGNMGNPGTEGISVGVVVVIVIFSTGICAVIMYYTGKAVVIRRRRRRLHAFGHMTHSLSVQTDDAPFSSISAGGDDGQSNIVFSDNDGALVFQTLEIDNNTRDDASARRKRSVFEE